MKRSSVWVLVLLAIGAPAAGEEPLDLEWMVGDWCSSSAAGTSEEHWLAAKGGLMLGIGRTVTQKGTQFEFLRIELAGNTARYIAQPNGGQATTFDLVDASPGRVTFANPQHDFPKRIRYQRDGETLTARVDGGADESPALQFKWTRCPD